MEKKELSKIKEDRGLVMSTLYGHLETAILLGLPVNYERLEVTLSDISAVEQKIRKPPINSSSYNMSIWARFDLFELKFAVNFVLRCRQARDY